MDNIISSKSTILDAIRMLSNMRNGILIVFVVDNEDRLMGALTDGDIRRFLANGGELYQPIDMAMNRDCISVNSSDNNYVKQLQNCKKKKINIVPLIDKGKHILSIIDLINYKSHLPMDAVIMAGGKGERLRPLTLTTPKPLLPVGGKAIIDHNVDKLISYGVKHISVTVNYLAEQLEDHYKEPRQDVKVECVREPKFLGTMGAVRLVNEFHNDVVLVMNSDLFTDIDFEDMYLHFMENGADMSIAAVPYTVSIPYGICDLDGRNVKGIVEKPTYNYYANAGIYMIRKEIIEMIPTDEFYNATDLIADLVNSHRNVIRYPLKGTWIDIGSMSEYQNAQDLANHMN